MQQLFGRQTIGKEFDVGGRFAILAERAVGDHVVESSALENYPLENTAH